ncbi:MAG: acyltransferase family protein [Deltaproteobacteria bacterium]|nr:acyltransferase family protein [Deltaproteobacteria bacterium]
MTQSSKRPPPETDAPTADEGFRDPAMNQYFAGASDPHTTFEGKSDILSLEEIEEALRGLAHLPVVKLLSELVRRFGLSRFQALFRRLLAPREARVIDEFGFDEKFLEPLLPIARWFHDVYFRVESDGVEHIPPSGRALIVANHSGTLPYDASMVVTAVMLRHPARRHVRPLVEDFTYHLPYLGMFMSRVGAVRACQENAQRLLENDQATLVFPEGVKGIGKLYSKRYRLQRFGRGGAIRLALATRAPIIPCSIVGAEESMPLISKVSWLAKPLGLPYIPITPTLPWLGLLGLVPFPTKWFIDFGPPFDLSAHDPEALVHDRVLLNRLNEELRGQVQAMIDKRRAARGKRVFS